MYMYMHMYNAHALCTMYMHYYACACIPLFFQRKTLHINCIHNRIFPKNWGGGQIHYWPPNLNFGGAMAPPPAPPYSGPYDSNIAHLSLLCVCYFSLNYLQIT